MAKLGAKQPSAKHTRREIGHRPFVTFTTFASTNKQLPLCFRPLLKQIKNSAESHIVLDCSTERIYDVLKQAQQIGMMSDYHSYLITSLVSPLIK